MAAMPTVSAMQELRDSNGLLGDDDALDARWEEEGYLFFRGVLDEAAMTEARRKIMAVLAEQGLVEPDAEEPVWTGKKPEGKGPGERLSQLRIWEEFVATPAVDAFFEQVLGDRPRWIPIVQYRWTLPAEEELPDPVAGRHQDSFYNRDMAYRICWIPLIDIDEAIGGLALVPRMHKDGWLHDLSDAPDCPIPAETLPPESWHRTNYHPGDVVMFHAMTPHSGLPSSSDRLRLSFDLRVIPASAPQPAIGEFTAAGPDSLTVRTDDGETLTFAVDAETYLRGRGFGRAFSISEFVEQVQPLGGQIVVAHQEGKATFVRPPSR